MTRRTAQKIFGDESNNSAQYFDVAMRILNGRFSSLLSIGLLMSCEYNPYPLCES